MTVKSKERLTRKVSLRMTKTESDQLTKLSEEMGVRPSAALRLALERLAK